MAIDAVIDVIRHRETCYQLWLRPRIDSDGRATQRGRRRVMIERNPDYVPQPGDEIWGNSAELVISKGGIDHKFPVALWGANHD